MYLKKLWIENIWDKKVYCWDFSNPDGDIRRWSILECSDESKNTLIFKLIGICFGAVCNLSQLARKILLYHDRREGPGYFGVVLSPDLSKNGKGNNYRDIQIQYKILPEGEIRLSRVWNLYWRAFRYVSKGFNDLITPLGWFAYGYNSKRENSVHEDLGPALVPRLRSSRFGTFFYDLFPLTSANDWLFQQYRNAKQHNSKKAEYLYNVSMSLIMGIFQDLKFSHWGENNSLYFARSSRTCSISCLSKSYILLIDFLIDLVRQMADSKKIIRDFNLCEGILFIDYFEKLFCLADRLSGIKTLSNMFPNMQFIVSCYEQSLVNQIKSLYDESVPSQFVKTKVLQWISTVPSRAKLIRCSKQG